jgi:hypothetical protein
MTVNEINGFQCSICGRLYRSLDGALSCDHGEAEEE